VDSVDSVEATTRTPAPRPARDAAPCHDLHSHSTSPSLSPPQKITAKEKIVSTNVVTTQLLLTVEQAAERLGVGRTTMYGLLKAGAIESVPVGRLRRIPPDALEAYIANLRTATSGAA
jgi:excisionase family DNA binding protein